MAGVLGSEFELPEPEADVLVAAEKGGGWGGARREGFEVDWSGMKGEVESDDSERYELVEVIELRLSL